MAARREAVLDAAVEELVESGVASATMASIARRAGASKETLYSWFGSREGMLSAIIQRNADRSSERISAALEDGAEIESTLADFGAGLLRMLTAPGSLAINRAAMSDAGLAAELLASGRHRVGPLVEAYLASAAADGRIHVVDPADAFETFYGLLVRDWQITCLLGEAPPDDEAVLERARIAVDQFLVLYAPRV